MNPILIKNRVTRESQTFVEGCFSCTVLLPFYMRNVTQCMAVKTSFLGRVNLVPSHSVGIDCCRGGLSEDE